MNDPMERLHRPASPAEPRPEFVDALRQRVVNLLDLSVSSGVSTSDSPSSDSRPTVVISMEELALSNHARAATRPRRVAVLAVAAVVAAVVAAGLIARDRGDTAKVVTDPPTTLERSTSTSVRTTRSSDLPAVQTFAQAGGQSFTTTGRPWLQAVAGDSLWVLHEQQGAIERRNKRTGAVLGSVPVAVGPVASTPIEGFGSLWVAVATRGVVVRIDLQTAAVRAEIPIPGGLTKDGGVDFLSDLVVAEGGVWTLTASPDRTLVRIDPATNTVTKTLAIGNATDVAYGAGSFWVTRGGSVGRLNADGVETARIEVTQLGALVKFFAGQVWVLGDNLDRLRLARIDPATNRVVAEFPVSTTTHGEIDVAFGGGFLWVGSVDAAVVKVDPTTNTVVARFGEGFGFNGVAADDEAVWLSGTGSGQLVRLPLN